MPVLNHDVYIQWSGCLHKASDSVQEPLKRNMQHKTAECSIVLLQAYTHIYDNVAFLYVI